MAKLKKGSLGRGLDALLGETASLSSFTENEDNSSLSTLPLRQLEPNRNQPRTHFDEESLESLAESIRQHGLLQPILVRKQENGYYQIIAGERRWRAARLANLKEVPVLILDLNHQETAEIALIENLQRENLNPLEEASGYQRLISVYGLTQEECALRVGKSRSAVANALRLLSLSPAIQNYLKTNVLSAGHARALLSVSDGTEQEHLAKQAAEQQWSVRKTEQAARSANNKGIRSSEIQNELQVPVVDYTKAAAQELSEQWGRKIQFISQKKKGLCEIEFYGEEDLTALIEILKQFPRSKNQNT